MTLIFDESETLSVVSELFSKEFEVSFSTKLIGGADEPLYLCLLYTSPSPRD